MVLGGFRSFHVLVTTTRALPTELTRQSIMQVSWVLMIQTSKTLWFFQINNDNNNK